MLEWDKYKPGMKIEGRDMKVGGRPRTLLAVDTGYQIPAGLLGHCTSQHSGYSRIRFSRNEGKNPHLWSLIMRPEGGQSSHLTLKIDNAHLRQMLVGDLIPEDAQQRIHALLNKQGQDIKIKWQGGASGVRG